MTRLTQPTFIAYLSCVTCARHRRYTSHWEVFKGICGLVGDMHLNKEWEIQNDTLLIRIPYDGTMRRKGVSYLLPMVRCCSEESLNWVLNRFRYWQWGKGVEHLLWVGHYFKYQTFQLPNNFIKRRYRHLHFLCGEVGNKIHTGKDQSWDLNPESHRRAWVPIRCT